MNVTDQVLRPEPVNVGRTGIAVVGALVLANVANYAFQIVAGRGLSVAEYGSLAGYMSAVTVITVSASAIQMTAARTIAAGESELGARRFFDGLTRSTLLACLVVGLAILVASPVISALMSFEVLPTIILGVYALPATMDSIAAGRLQGLQRFPALATYSAGQAAARLTVVAVALALGAGVAGVIGSIVASSLVVALLGRRASRSAGAIDSHVLSSDGRRAFAAMTLFWVILSMDVPIAHARFDEGAAGIYAAGAVLGKAVLWLPITIAQIVFPTLAERSARGVDSRAVFWRASAIVGVMASASVGGLVALGDWAYGLLYGDRYAGAGAVAWKIGLAMVPLAVVNLAMFDRLARQDGRFIRAFIATAIGLVIALCLVPADATAFAITLVAAGSVLATVLIVLEVLDARMARIAS